MTYRFQEGADILKLCLQGDAFPLEYSNCLASFVATSSLVIQLDLDFLGNTTTESLAHLLIQISLNFVPKGPTDH